MLKRRLNSQGSQDPSSIDVIAFDTVAGGKGWFQVAPKLSIVGALDAAKGVGMGRVLWIFNSDLTAVHYVAVGAVGMGAPTGGADGIGVPPGQYICINTADAGGFVRSDSALVFGYAVVRDSVLIDVPDSNA